MFSAGRPPRLPGERAPPRPLTPDTMPTLALRAALRPTAALLLLLGSGCVDALPLGPSGERPREGEGSPELQLAEIRCQVSVATESLSCAAPPTADSVAADIVYGGQNVFVQLVSSAVDYDPSTHKFVFNVTIRNLIRQAIGTSDGVAADPSGVRIFFSQLPTANAGTGDITIDNPDGSGTFTASDQPFYRYAQRIEPFATSSPRTWRFDVPPSVESFAFTVYVSAPVRYPTGWIEPSHPSWALRRTYQKALTARVYDQFGREIEGAVVTWSSDDPARATIDPTSGLVSGLLPGAVTLTATSSNDVYGQLGATQTGTAVWSITGVAQEWTQAGGTDDWNTAANWSRNVDPVAEDSVTIPVVGSGIYPVLVENEYIGSITVADGAQLDLGPFNLVASQDVISAPFSGGILGSAGRLWLTGASNSVTGRLPRIRVMGRYALTGNVQTTTSLQVQSGRLRNTGFRIRAIP